MKGQLFILVEGNDDERFFTRVVKPLLQERYSRIQIWKYSRKKLEKTKNFVRSIQLMKADYVYVTDLDEAPCVTSKKEEVLKKVGIDGGHTLIVVKEIEGWFLAGLQEKEWGRLGIPPIPDTDSIVKEDFNAIVYGRIQSRIAFMERILKRYDIEAAKGKNRSFRYFLDRYGL